MNKSQIALEVISSVLLVMYLVLTASWNLTYRIAGAFTYLAVMWTLRYLIKSD